MISILYIFFILLACILAKREGYLTTSGSIAAMFVGTGISYGLGWKGLILLGVFFLTSSLLSRYKQQEKKAMENKLEKGSTRDAVQVLANGGFATVSSILYGITDISLFIGLFCVLLAAANSDTWASEIGSLSKKRPFSIRSLRREEIGTSGAISILGTIAAISGSAIIAFGTYFLFHFSLLEIMLIICFGFLGCIIDTILGAFIQGQFLCSQCNQHVEKRWHCGHQTLKISGYSFINNDVVNIVSGVFAAIFSSFFF